MGFDGQGRVCKQGTTVATSRATSGLGSRLVLFVAAAAATLLITGAVASACTAMAVLEFDQAAPGPGDEVTGSGRGFRASHGQTQTQEVVIRFDTRDGEELTTTEAGPDGGVSFSFTVPEDASAGHHVIVATQRDVQGTPVYGTPARQSLRVADSATASSSGAASPLAAANGSKGATDGTDVAAQAVPQQATADPAAGLWATVPAVEGGTVALGALAVMVGLGTAAVVRQRQDRLLTARP